MTPLDHLVQQLTQKAASQLTSRTTLADTIGKITYSIPVGIALDYVKNGLADRWSQTSGTRRNALRSFCAENWLCQFSRMLASLAASPFLSAPKFHLCIGGSRSEPPFKEWWNFSCFKSGLRGWGIVSSRAFATGINFFTGYPYGKWREGWYQLTKTTEESSSFRKGLVELGAVNTFETYVYGAGVCLGSLVQNGEINYWDVQSGMEGLILLSPFIGPTMGWWLDGTRRLFKVKPAAEWAYHRQKS